jgi:hypothetical protein
MVALKPIDTRTIEARGRARALGVRVQAVAPARHYRAHSQCQPGMIYDLLRTRGGWTCSCDGWTHTGCCKHLGQLVRRAEREGWAFGAIARPARGMPA